MKRTLSTLFYFTLATATWAQQLPSYNISTIAGADPSGDGGIARNARLYRPGGVVSDPQGIIYFCDGENGRVRRIGRDQVITTIAGGGTKTVALDGDPATSVRLLTPTGIALNAATNSLFFSDSEAHIVYGVNLTTGAIVVIAGTGTRGSSGDQGSSKRALLNNPRGLAFDSTIGLLISDSDNHRVRRVDLNTGVISNFAGTGSLGFSGDGAAAIAGRLFWPEGLSVGLDHVVYIGDWGNSRIRRVKPDGIMDTVAGTGSGRLSGDGGPATSAGVDGYAAAVGSDGSLYLAEEGFNVIRRINPAGVISTIAGSTAGYSGDGGLASTAQLNGPTAVALDNNGNVLVADTGNHRLRRVSVAANQIDTIAGRNRFGGEGGPASAALFTTPQDVAYDAAGNLYIADTGNHVIRKIARDGNITTVAGVGGESGKGAEGIAATTSRLNSPTSVVVDTDGGVYVGDRGNGRIRRVDPNGTIRTISGTDAYGVEGMALQAAERRLYFADSAYHQVLRMDLANSTALPVVIAGSPNFRPGFSGDGGPAVSALLSQPAGVTVAPNGEIYVVDTGNVRLRKINAAGVITTVAGSGVAEIVPTDGPLAAANLTFPMRALVDPQGSIFVTEAIGRVRRINGDRIDTIAGGSTLGFAGDGGPARDALLRLPTGLVRATDGSLVVADAYNQRIRVLTPVTTPPPTVVSKLEIRAGNNQTGTVGQLLPQALSVIALNASNQPVAGTVITFAVTTGTATLSVPSVTTGTDGLASVTVTPTAAGAVQVTARSGSLTPVVFALTANPSTQPPPANRPIISNGGIIGVGVSVPAVTSLAPRGIISIFGQNFLEAGTTGRRVDFNTEMVNGALPTRLLGVCVEIGGTRAPMLDVFPNQLNVVVPAVTGSTAAVRVIRRCDQTDAATSEPASVAVAPVAPEFLYSQLNLDGRNPVAAVNAVTGALIGPASLSGFTPARGGDVLTIYATGFGATSPAIAPGGTSSGAAGVTASVRVRIGSVELNPADVLYVGSSPGSLIYQVNLRVPSGLPTGNLPVQILLDNIASPPNAYLAIAGGETSNDVPQLEQHLRLLLEHRRTDRLTRENRLRP